MTCRNGRIDRKTTKIGGKKVVEKVRKTCFRGAPEGFGGFLITTKRPSAREKKHLRSRLKRLQLVRKKPGGGIFMLRKPPWCRKMGGRDTLKNRCAARIGEKAASKDGLCRTECSRKAKQNAPAACERALLLYI